MKNTPNLRTGLLALMAPLTLALSSGALAQTRTLTVSTFGLNQALFDKNVTAPFEAKCGCKLVYEVGNTSDRLAKLDARRANPNIDLALLSSAAALEASQKGLLDVINPAKLSNYSRLYDFAKDPIGGHYAVGYTVYSVGLVYRTDKVRNFKSWQDLWRPDLKGRIALPNITTTQGPLTLMMANTAWNGPDTDFTTGLQKLAAVKGNVVTLYNQSAQLASLFAQEEIWAAPAPRFVWGNLQKTGLPLRWLVPAEGQAADVNVMTLVKGSKNNDLAYQLMDFWLSKDVQTNLANDLADSPANKTVLISAEKGNLLTYGVRQIRSLKFLSPAQQLKQRTDWVDFWNKNVAR
ncbi:ABC transporter substrate-binding protein [Deinococcus sp. UYEF24]